MSEPPSVATALVERWDALVRDLGVDPDGVVHERSVDLRDDLIARYGEAHRHHHDRRHLLEVLVALDQLAPHPPSVPVRLAAWFHDAVYDGVAGDDERASAALAREELGVLDLAPALVEVVAAMVEATAGHLVPGDGPEVDVDTAVLLDADLSILAAATARYDDYAGGIRAEHPELDDERFRTGRLAAVRTLAGREHLFHTEVGRTQLEAAARRNLAREIDQLSSPEDGG